jgi:3-oxoacyl-[acyl-carrier-protein] synthase-1
MTSRYPVTAYALCNALGATTAEVIASLRAGRSGLRPCELDVPFTAKTGAVPGPLEAPPSSLAPWDTRLLRIALRSLDELAPRIDAARSRWGRDRIAVILGTSTAGIEETERAWGARKRTGSLPPAYDWDRQHACHALLEVVRTRTGLRGPGWIVSTACSSSGKAFATAHRLLDAGACDAVLVGGVDSLCQTTLRGFHSLELLSEGPCRPFAADRKGISIGEGCALALLERTGDAAAALLGEGETSDAHHMTAPHPEGAGARAAMEQALARAGLVAEQVDHIDAHGTGTVLNDAAEGRAIRELWGDRVPVVSTKGYTGHLLGAAGATEALFSVFAIEQGWIPASLGAEPVDARLGIWVATSLLQRRCRVVLSNSFAFGGSNVSLAFGAAA